MTRSKLLKAALAPAAIGMVLLAAPVRAAALDASLKPGDHAKLLDVNGLERSYYLHIPPQYDGKSPLPLVLLFHGGGGSGTTVDDTAGMSDKADVEGFIAVYPNGSTGAQGRMLTWNAGKCCGGASEKNVDDVAFVRALVSALKADLNVDPARIYAAGMSNGGMLCYRLACEMPGVFAAVAPVAATMFDLTCAPSAPVSLIAFNGTKDSQVAYDGGVGTRAIFKVEGKPLPAVIQFWADKNGCKEKEAQKIGVHVRKETRKGGKNGTEVVLYTVDGGGHAWPGGTRAAMKGEISTREINATDLIWEFFKGHPKRS